MRLKFARQQLGTDSVHISPASSDASFRSYWRVITPDHSYILMDAPPDKEDIRPWLLINRRLHAAGIHSPSVIAEDIDQGFILMEDLGSRTYLPELNTQTVNSLYADAFDALIRMQTDVDVTALPTYDETRLVNEMELLPEWFLKHHLCYPPSCEEWDIIEHAFSQLIHSALAQPRTFVHRDYHSRNLLITEKNSPGVIDFQDAVIGPITYDAVSLLRDCYIAWDIERVDGWVENYRQRLRHAHLIDTGISGSQFRRWFDLMGLQRHIKVLGIFCRLYYRDGKQHYLNDLPLVWHYVVSVAQHYPEFTDFIALLKKAIGAWDLTMPQTDIPAGTES